MGNADWAHEALRDSNVTGPTDAEINKLIAEAGLQEATSAEAQINELIDELEASVAEAPHELSASERIAEHTGSRRYVIADDIADCLNDSGVDKLTSAQRMLIAHVLGRYGV